MNMLNQLTAKPSAAPKNEKARNTTAPEPFSILRFFSYSMAMK